MTNLNTTHGADLVITKSAPGRYAVYALGDVIANVETIGLSLILAGAVAANRTAYDADTGK